MAGRSARKFGVAKTNGAGPKASSEDHVAPASEEDKREWKGFCEIESEPAFFNAMLKKFGVQGVKVQEVVSLDEEMLSFLPRPVYGLIFLFRWTEEDPDKQEQSCPQGVWFANQTSNNACASVALLNIVNNIPEIELGDNLREFKLFTADFSPALRGDAISNFEFVKNIHNTFAREIPRKMDMLNADLLLKNEVIAKGKGKMNHGGEDENDAGFHFIAFMPIGESLWKFDGLERQPMSLGFITGDWVAQATPDIRARMAQYEESQIEFAILSLVKDPLISLLSDLAENVVCIRAIQSRLDTIQPDWKSFTAEGGQVDDGAQEFGFLTGPDGGLGLKQEQISATQVREEMAARLRIVSTSDGLAIHRDLITAQQRLIMSIQEELQSKHLEEERACARTRDFGAKMQKFARKVMAKEMS